MTMPLIDENALEWIDERALLLAKEINKTTLEALKKILSDGFARGDSIKQITNSLSEYFPLNEKWRAERIARNEVITASNRGANDRYQKEGIQQVEWLASPGACPECSMLDGKIFPIDSGERPALHPNCVCTILPVIN